jgi:hypothetical protein
LAQAKAIDLEDTLVKVPTAPHIQAAIPGTLSVEIETEKESVTLDAMYAGKR